jgi:hypothetical protein
MYSFSLSAQIFSGMRLGALGPLVLECLSAADTAKVKRVAKCFRDMAPKAIEHQLATRIKIDFEELTHYQKLLKDTFLNNPTFPLFFSQAERGVQNARFATPRRS